MALHHVMSANAGISKMASSFTCLEPKLGRLEQLGLDRRLSLHALSIVANSLGFLTAW